MPVGMSQQPGWPPGAPRMHDHSLGALLARVTLKHLSSALLEPFTRHAVCREFKAKGIALWK